VKVELEPELKYCARITKFEFKNVIKCNPVKHDGKNQNRARQGRNRKNNKTTITKLHCTRSQDACTAGFVILLERSLSPQCNVVSTILWKIACWPGGTNLLFIFGLTWLDSVQRISSRSILWEKSVCILYLRLNVCQCLILMLTIFFRQTGNVSSAFCWLSYANAKWLLGRVLS